MIRNGIALKNTTLFQEKYLKFGPKRKRCRSQNNHMGLGKNALRQLTAAWRDGWLEFSDSTASDGTVFGRRKASIKMKQKQAKRAPTPFGTQTNLQKTTRSYQRKTR